MKKINFGIVGLKGIGQTHLKAIKSVEEANLTAVADINEDVGKAAASQFNVKWYADYEEMLDLGNIDAVIVCTPHFLHAPMALKAMEHGKHVLVEKPMAISVAEADEMINLARDKGLKLGVVYQYRFRPVYQEIKRIIKAGELGGLLRVCMEACTFRTQFYYGMDKWRGKWATEGGGVLINQTIHYLDLLQWFAGKPSMLQGWISTMFHNVEVEDIASAAMLFENGAHGVLQVSTVEGIPIDRLEISGERGKIINEGSGLRLGLLERPVRDYILESAVYLEDAVWGKPRARWLDIETKKDEIGHVGVIEDFSLAILEDRDPLVSGEEGRTSLEIVNAIILSSYEEKPVKFPIDREKYANLMGKLKKTKN